MQRSDFYFDLPDALIAQHPLESRTASRLLCLDGVTGAVDDRRFTDIESFLAPGDLLVLNDTRVIPARLFGHKESGGKVEVLVERIVSETQVLAHVRASKSPKPGTFIILDDGSRLQMSGRKGELFELELVDAGCILDKLEAIGHMPLPPYISRPDSVQDQQRYQSVFAKNRGAVAAPTASLHFDTDMLQRLEDSGVGLAYVTLHVGAGTFQPVRVDDIQTHYMHSEWISVSQGVCDQVEKVRAANGRVVAVGTTAVRCLETAAGSGRLMPYEGETDIFIYPGYRFKIIDALITNFHLPESTLLMLVSAFAGFEHTRAAYRHAVQQAYRFFSYGDAMLLSAPCPSGDRRGV